MSKDKYDLIKAIQAELLEQGYRAAYLITENQIKILNKNNILIATIWFREERAELYCTSGYYFEYSNPDFPNNLYRRLKIQIKDWRLGSKVIKK